MAPLNFTVGFETPPDLTRTEHVGKVDRVVFNSPGGDYCILVLGDGVTVLGPADGEADFQPGHVYRFLGRWVNDRERGHQFKFSTFALHAVAGRRGVVKYLQDVCSGVGPVKAEKLWSEYGGSAVDALRDDPERVARECGFDREFCREACASLRLAKGAQDTKIRLFELTDRRGFSGKMIDAAIKLWGAKAPDVVRKNPFNLLGLPSAGFKRCDKLWTDLGLRPDAMKRQVLLLAHLAGRDRDGHTWLRAESLAQALLDSVPGADWLRAVKVALRARKLAKRRDAVGVLFLAVYGRAEAEARVARNVKRLRGGVNLWPAHLVPVSREAGDGLASEHQVERLTLATGEALGILCGTPGSGKTFLTAAMLRAIVQSFGRSAVAVCAPTGKAAVRARQALTAAGLGVPTSTIHALLRIKQAGYGTGDWGFEFNEGNPLPYKFVVVDEVSMVSTGLLASLLSACATGTHVLFVGDPYQLPPVEHGAPLRDMMAAGVACGELTQVRRNAGRIVHACLRIKNGEDFETSGRVDLDADPPENLKLYHAADEARTLDVLDGLLQRMTKFHPVKQCQVIVGRNKSRTALNDRLQRLLNPDGRQAKGNPFRVGDKVICTRNGMLQAVELAGKFAAGHESAAEDPRSYNPVTRFDENGKPEAKEVYVANGEIGFAVAVSESLTIARFGESDSLVRVPMGKSTPQEEDDGGGGEEGGRGCNFDLAYACTCHKLQGSESPCVIVVADEASGMVASKNWWYTAISRASKLCLLVGKKSVIDRQRARDVAVKRKTFLAELIAETAVTP